MGLNIKAHLNSTIEKQTYDFISPVEEDSSLYGHSKKKYSQGKGFQKHFSPICFTIAFKKKLVEWEIFTKNGKTL